MTNKINGIDVSECEFLRKCVIPDNEGCSIDDSLCCDVGNCYFKQLKRLQEENEGLKSLNDFNVQKIEVLQKENEKQKELIKQLEDFIKTDGEIDHINHEYTYKLQKENEELKKKNKELLNLSNTGGALLVAESTKNKKYRQALEEIKTFAKPIKENTCFGMYCGFVDFVLEQCDEVLNDNSD